MGVGSWLLLALLLLIRVPSLAQPAGADQGLYAYVGTRILHGELSYRDAWDQKPPAIHFAYALMYAAWSRDSVVAAADLAAAAAVALMLVPLGSALTGGVAAGRTAAALFLLLGDPTLGRLAGVRVRSQCETFIAVAVTAALVLAVRMGRTRARNPEGLGILVGALLGIALTFKYNAVVYIPVVLLALFYSCGDVRRGAGACLFAACGVATPVVAMLLVFAAGGAFGDLYDATVTYNLKYSGETYSGAASFISYLLTFAIRQARVDSIWTVGGLGCLILLAHAVARRWNGRPLLPVLWVAAACLSIAINGSRGLPQYFVQAAPALALAAGVAAATLWPATLVPPRLRVLARTAAVLLVALAAWRVTEFSKIPKNIAHDVAYVAGRVSRDEHLARYGGRDVDKYSALGVTRLGEYLKSRTTPTDRIYIFGFSPGAYVKAERASASRFFWSRPILVGFNAHKPGYGAEGVLDELRAHLPAYVVLQAHDWAPPPNDSVTYFSSHPLLGPWLRDQYSRVTEVIDEDYEVWKRQKP